MSAMPSPTDDFADFARVYEDACRARGVPAEALAAKWTPRDLIPGLSDLDMRIVVGDGATPEDWCRLSMTLGEAHLALCREYPRWARTLEHPPGIGLTWSELASGRVYFTEYRQWTFLHTDQPERLAAFQRALDARPWDEKDELFHLKKFCAYYGRYDRALDPPVNLGNNARRYPLHSRIMHYFCPPTLAAVSLLERRTLAGKREAFERAERAFPERRCWRIIREILEAHYETPRWYGEPFLSELEDEFESALRAMAARLREAVTLVPQSCGTDVAAWKAALQAVPVSPLETVFDSYRFARLFKGRMFFYANAPDGFETTFLIRNELGRIGEFFFRGPFRAFWLVRTGEKIADPLSILESLRGGLLTDAEIAGTREFARLVDRPCADGKEKERAAAIVERFDDFFRAFSRIKTAVEEAL